jgi:hypothetical protein
MFQIEELVRRQLGEESIEPLPSSSKQTEELMIKLAEEFLSFDLEEIDPVAYLDRIYHLRHPFTADDVGSP